VIPRTRVSRNILMMIAANDWGKATINITQVGNFTKAPYKYKLTPLKQVEKLVKAGAGLGKI
jgi:pectate lyase